MADELAGDLVAACGYRASGEHRDARQAVGAVPVATRDPVHDPGERLGQEAERPRDRAVQVVDVRQHSGADGGGTAVTVS